jgi:3-hydroxymyristoyl/3-hydroxydecanoyl-(acyl carrier protein) dehydratase
VKFRKFVQPGDQLFLDVRLESFEATASRVSAKGLINGKMVTTLSAEFTHLTREEYIKAYLQ